MLDETAHAGQEHLDARYVAGYDVKAGVDPAEDVDVLRRHGLGSGSILVELGAGTGELAITAAGHCRRVVAVDVSPAMLALARRKAETVGVANIQFVQAGFLSGLRPATAMVATGAANLAPPTSAPPASDPLP